MGTIEVFRLEWQSNTLVVTTQMVNATTPQGESYALYSAPSLSANAARGKNVEVWRTFSPAEAMEAEYIAAECLVAYGWGYNGLLSPDGAYRVNTPQGELSLSSFPGYSA